MKLYWLGTPLVELKGRAVKLETRKTTALLAYLSMQRGECSREHLATMFWPEKDQGKALGNLRRALASLNTSLLHTVNGNRETVSLMREKLSWLDVDAFHEELKVPLKHNHTANDLCDECLAHLQKAVDIYRGDFLEGLNLTDAPAFDEWQFLIRDSLRQELAGALQRLSAGYQAREKWDLAIACARRWLAIDHLHEPACRMLITALSLAGQRAAAVRQYEELERALSEQLGQEPEAETQQLLQQVRGRVETKTTTWPAPSTVPFPLLKTKLFIPGRPASRVIRSRLVSRMKEIAKKPLTLISAPAGFGKTTLLAEWIAQTSMPVAWLSLDQGDNDPYRFLAYLIAALESLQENVGEEAQQIMQANQDVPLHIVLASLINALEGARQPTALILEDAQFITNNKVNEALAYLLDHLPTNLHLVISTRADPPLQLGRLRANEQLLELRTQDLRFSEEETREFFNAVMQLKLSPGDIEALHLRTEGWVVGLKMAALSLNQCEDVRQFIKAFSGSQRYILDYLVEEVLRRQPEPIQEFLLKTSILDKLCGLLCDTVLDWKPGQAIGSSQSVLEYLERTNIFVTPLDDHKQWYRYHRLFSELLRTQLHRSVDAQGVTQLHLRASNWYAQNDLTLDAIEHASMAADEERVERLIEQNYLEVVRRGEMLGLRYWTGKLNKDLVYRRPWLCIYEAYSHSWFGELDEADVLLEVAEKRIRSSVSAPEADSMLGQLIYVKSRVAAMHGNLPRAIEFNLAAREYLPVSNVALQLDMGITLGYLHFLNGDYEHAEPPLSETIQSGRAVGAVLNTVAGYCILARLRAHQGRLRESYSLYQQAAEWINETGEKHLGASSLVQIGMAEALYERNELESALAQVSEGLAHIHLWGKADDLVLGCLSAARIHRALEDTARAAEFIERAEKVVRTTGLFPEAPLALELDQVKFWLGQGNRRAASGWARAAEDRFDPQAPITFQNELMCIAQARVWIAENRSAEAITLLSRLEQKACSDRRLGHLIEILLLKALALNQARKGDEALQALANSIELAEPEGYMRLFLNEGEPIARLLDQLRQGKAIPTTQSYILRLLQAHGSS